MSDPTREEYDAKLEAVEARLETRLVAIDGKLDRLFDRVEVAVSQASQANTAAEGAKSAASATKWNILFTALGTAAVLLAMYAVVMQAMDMVGSLMSAARG